MQGTYGSPHPSLSFFIWFIMSRQNSNVIVQQNNKGGVVGERDKGEALIPTVAPKVLTVGSLHRRFPEREGS